MQALGFDVEQREVEAMIDSVDKSMLTVLADCLRYHPARFSLSRAYFESNADRNGQIEFEEFVDMMTAKMSEKDSKEEMEKAFRLFDAEGSGRITLETLRQVSSELGEDLKDDELIEMIEEADKDKKGFVSERDFVNLMKKATSFFV